jgi:hypothetical protein
MIESSSLLYTVFPFKVFLIDIADLTFLLLFGANILFSVLFSYTLILLVHYLFGVTDHVE